MHYTAWPVYGRRYADGTLPIGLTIVPGRIENNIETYFQILPQFFNGSYSYITTPGNYSDSFDIQYWKTDKSTNRLSIYTSGAGNRLRNVMFEITKVDTIKHFISGLFSFTLYVKNSNNQAVDSTVVTDGRFDLPFAQEACSCSPN